MAATFDLNKLHVTGQPVPPFPTSCTLSALATAGTTPVEAVQRQQHRSARLCSGRYLSGAAASLVWKDHKGNSEPAVPFKGGGSVRLSPDARRIAYIAGSRGKCGYGSTTSIEVPRAR